MKKSTFSVTDTAILAAFCVFLSLIEYLIPRPMPFMRLGLANVPIILSLQIFPKRGTLLLSILKIVGQGLINGTLFSYIFIFSACGSMASCLVMIAVYSLLRSGVSLIGVSAAGAMASNIVQLLLARQFIFGKAAELIAPPFLTAGLVTAAALGVFTAVFSRQSEWVRQRSTGSGAFGGFPDSSRTDTSAPGGEQATAANFAFICGLLAIPAFIFQTGLVSRAVLTLIFIILSVVSGRKFRVLPNLIMAAGIIAANLIAPHGRILLEAGRFSITAGALETGVMKALLIIGLIYISRGSIKKGLSFPGRAGRLLTMVFYYFEKITEGERLKRENIIAQLDEKLLKLSGEQDADNGDTGKASVKNNAGSYLAAALPCLLAWLMLLSGPWLRH